MPQLHVNMEKRFYLRLKIAVKQLGYGSTAEWARSMARSTIRKAELSAIEETGKNRSMEAR